jgi:hypothetical protein
MINNRTIIISGSAHSGKTTFVNNLIHCFDEYYLIPEVSTIIINRWKDSGRKFYWETKNIKDLRDFQEEVAEVQYNEIMSLETFIKECPRMDFTSATQLYRGRRGRYTVRGLRKPLLLYPATRLGKARFQSNSIRAAMLLENSAQ